MVDRGSRRGDRVGIVRSSGDGEGALPRRRQHHLRRQPLADPMAETEPNQAGRREQDGGPVRVRFEFGQPGVHVAPDVLSLKVGPGVQQLGPAPEAAGGDHGAPRHLAPSERSAAHERVAGVLPLSDRRDGDPLRQLGRQVLQGVDRDVDPPVEHRVVDLAGEERGRADPGKRHVLDDVAGGADLDPLGGPARPARSARIRSVCHSARALPRVPTRSAARGLTGRPSARPSRLARRSPRPPGPPPR